MAAIPPFPLTRVCLDGQDRCAAREHAELVLVVLELEDLPARKRDDSDLEALLLERLGGLEDEADLGTGGDDGDVGVGDLLEDVTTLGGLLDGRTLELGQVLTGEAEGGR